MTTPKPPRPRPPNKKEGPGNKAFLTFLERGLHELYDEVAREPVPEELLKLIRDHGEK